MGTVWPCNSEFVCSSWVAIVGSLGLPRFFASEKTGPCRVCASQRKANVSCVGYGQVQSLSMCLNVPQFPLHIPRGLIDATPPPPQHSHSRDWTGTSSQWRLMRMRGISLKGN